MPCSCINHPLGRVIWGALADCVGKPSIEVNPDGVCLKCGANAPLEGYCSECEEYDRDRKLADDQDSDKDYRKGNN